jgi:poly(3-hydroxybutyrate) depolymerase
VVPTIVFHGEQDRTVNPRNGEEVIAAALGIAGGRARSTDSALAEARLEEGVSALGGRYTRSIQHDENGNVLTEHWRVHEGGHAWAGGDARGSYTDATGPDATREMYRFFTEHSQGAV